MQSERENVKEREESIGECINDSRNSMLPNDTKKVNYFESTLSSSSIAIIFRFISRCRSTSSPPAPFSHYSPSLAVIPDSFHGLALILFQLNEENKTVAIILVFELNEETS